MLITIVHTVNYGKVVLHKYPYEKVQLEHQGLEKLPTNEIFEVIAETFDYFGMYRKKSLIQTWTDPLPQKAVIEMFMANEKFSQVTLGIDDGCVLVTRSVFLENRSSNYSNQNQKFSDNVEMIDVGENKKSQIISITLIWRQDNYEKLDDTKHHLSFLLGILQRKEQHEQFLTKELIKIMQERQRLKRKIRDIFTFKTKQTTNTDEEVRIKLLAKDIDTTAKNIRDQLPLFSLLKKYYECWVKGELFEMKEEKSKEEKHCWEGTIGCNYLIETPPADFIERINNRTLVIIPPKLKQLPAVLYADRVRYLYEKSLSFSKYSIKKLLNRNKDINPAELYHTAYFLLRNNFAVDIYPIDHPSSYNLYALKDLPSKSLIDKFNNRIFPGKNLIEILNIYSKYHPIMEQEETLKYLILKGIAQQVGIYIFRKRNIIDDAQFQGQSLIYNMVEKYCFSNRDINEMLATEPFGSQGQLLNQTLKFIKNHKEYYGFYFVEKV